MKQFMSFLKRLSKSDGFAAVFKALVLWLLMTAVFIYLLNADLSSAPEFIYNQF